MIANTIGYLMAGVFIIVLMTSIRYAVGSWKHSIIAIAVAIGATLWIVVAGLLIENSFK